MSSLVAQAEAKRHRAAHDADDMGRILALPIDTGLTPEEVEEWSRVCVKPEWFARGFRLRDKQAWALLALLEVGGLFGPIAVGGGKTLICVKGAADLYRYRGVERILHFMPAKNFNTFVKRDLPMLHDHLYLHGLPVHLLGRRSAKDRLAIAESGLKGCYVMPYSMLSRENAEDVVRAIAPGAVFFDEAHAVKKLQGSARARRIFDYIGTRNVQGDRVIVVALSGTMSSKSMMDCHHIMVACLGQSCPVPLTQSGAIDWASVIDANATPSPQMCEKLVRLLAWARTAVERGEPDAPAELVEDPTTDLNGYLRSFRTAYQYRLHSAPGVVATDDDDEFGGSIIVANKDAETDTDEFRRLKELDDKVVLEWETPSGDEIDHAIHTFKWRRELAAGFYYDLTWPTADAVARKRECPEPQAEEWIKRSQEALAELNFYRKELRTWLQHYACYRMDTPMLVGKEIAANGPKNVGERLHHFWLRKEEAKFPELVDRVRRPVRVCDYKIRLAAEWAERMGHGLIWYQHQEVGRWLMEAIPDAVYCPAGPAADERIMTSRGRVVVASIKSHGEGKNLQEGSSAHSNNLLVEVPREAYLMHQLMGRTHRPGQEEDELVYWTCNTVEFDDLLFSAMLNDSLFLHQTDQKQKPILSVYEPQPRIFPPRVLHERGFCDIRVLTERQQQTLMSLFSNPKAA